MYYTVLRLRDLEKPFTPLTALFNSDLHTKLVVSLIPGAVAYLVAKWEIVTSVFVDHGHEAVAELKGLGDDFGS